MHEIRENRKSGQGSLFQCSIKMKRNVRAYLLTLCEEKEREGEGRGGSTQDMGQESGLEKMREEKEELLEFFMFKKNLISS